VHSRTGDTKASERARFRRSAAHLLVTTPESLAVMLAQESYTMHLRECQFVIVDELHSFAGNKRGADLTLSLERLERLRLQADPAAPPLCRVGLSATAAPLDLLAQFSQAAAARAALPRRRSRSANRGGLLADSRKPYPAGRLHRRATLRGARGA
jgi:ATP-dependent Lhr-like helicase